MNILVPPSSLTPRIPAPDRTPVSFSGSPGEFFRLLLRGALLALPTAGFYRFWLITDIRRHLWGHTRIGRDAVEYTGTGRELLVGFLVALAVLAPIYVAYFALGFALEGVETFASVPLFLILYGFGQFAVYRARRYRATRTIFRGVRFWMTGSAWRYAGLTLLWDLVTVLSLGLALPWRLRALERYKMQNTRYGDLPGDFLSAPGTLFRRGIGLWAAAVVVPIGVVGYVAWKARTGAAGPLIAMVGLLVFVVLPVLFVLFRALVLRWTLEGLRFGRVSVDTGLTTNAVFACYGKWFLATAAYGLAFLLLMIALAGLSGGFGGWKGLAFEPEAIGFGAIAAFSLLYIAFLLGLGVIKRYFLDRGLWAAAASSLTIVNLSAADHVTAAGEAAGSLGEGLSDALDVGAI